MTALLEARGAAIAGRSEPTDIEISAGSMVALIGPNGSGKTSLLRALAAIEGVADQLRIDGLDLAAVPPARLPRLLSFLPASRDIAWPIRARDVVRLGAEGVELARIDALLSQLELEGLADRPVSHLSTGERARVLLARALAARPSLLLLDEPLSNLDPFWVLRILDIVRASAIEGAAALVSLHDIDKVGAFDRVLLMDGGRIIGDLPPDRMLASELLASTFRVERAEAGWRISPRADRRSSP